MARHASISPLLDMGRICSTISWHFDRFSDMDMLFHFKIQELVGLNENSTEASLTGGTASGENLMGTDTVNIVLDRK